MSVGLLLDHGVTLCADVDLGLLDDGLVGEALRAEAESAVGARLLAVEE